MVMHRDSHCQAVLHAELPHIPHLAPVRNVSPSRGIQSSHELRSLIQIQYSFFRDHRDYVYNPSALAEYYSYDPWKGLMLP